MAQTFYQSAVRRRASTRSWRRLRQSQGISLTELLIGVVISAIVLGAAVQALVSLIQGDSSAQVELNRKDDLGRVLAEMQDEIRNAQRVESGASLTALTGCSTTPRLILRGSSNNDDISYGLLSQANNTWRGPAVLVRCGPNYNSDGSLNAGTISSPQRSEQVVVDSLQTSGFTATTASGSGTIDRHVELTLSSNASGSTPRTVQVPISTNSVYSLSTSGSLSCTDGGSLSTGCLDPNGETRHYKPTLGGTDIRGGAGLEDVFYFDGRRAEYTLSRTPGSGSCTNEQCTVRLGTTGSSITFFDGDVLIFKDIEIRL